MRTSLGVAVAAGREWLEATVGVAREVGVELRRDRVTDMSAQIAFWGILSLFPALLAIAAALGSLEVLIGDDLANRAEREVVEFLERVLASDADGTVRDANDLFAQASPGVLTLGLGLAVWSASRAFAGVMRALDEVYELGERRSWAESRLVAVGLAVGSVLAGTVMLAMFVLGPLLGRGRDVADAVGLGGAFVVAWDWLRPPFAFALLALWAATILHVAPSRHTPWRSDLPGAITAAATWLVASVGLRFYLDLAATANQAFTVLGGALSVIVWLYLLALGLLVGAEVNDVLARRRGLGRPRRSWLRRRH